MSTAAALWIFIAPSFPPPPTTPPLFRTVVRHRHKRKCVSRPGAARGERSPLHRRWQIIPQLGTPRPSLACYPEPELTPVRKYSLLLSRLGVALSNIFFKKYIQFLFFSPLNVSRNDGIKIVRALPWKKEKYLCAGAEVSFRSSLDCSLIRLCAIQKLFFSNFFFLIHSYNSVHLWTLIMS